MSSTARQALVVHHRSPDFERARRHGLFILIFAWLIFLAANHLAAGLKNVGFTVGDPQSAAYGWSTLGNVTVSGGQAVLTEDGVRNPVRLFQQFTLSSNVTRIHITFQSLNLAANEAGQPVDALQISLLDGANNSLVPVTGQSGTTAFFNYQQDGKVYYGSTTTVPDATGSGTIWGPQLPVTIVLDVSALTSDQTATLSFDLGGFDQIASSVTLTRVRLEGIEPTAQNDSASTLEDAAAAISVLANDAAIPGSSLNPASVTVVGAPVHGTVTVNTQTGAINYQPATNYSGSDTLTYTVADAEGNVSSAATVSITVDAVNDPPTVDTMANLNLAEDAGQQSVSLTGITAGGGESQALTVTATSSSPGLIPNPTVNYNSPATSGSLTFTPAPNANGVATITVVVTDNGGTVNGGVDSVTNTFTVTVSAVNDPPGFTKGANQTVNEDAGTQTVVMWATAISRGPADETAQNVVFITSNNNSSLFSVQPAIAVNGTLTYTPAANANGVATVTVQIRDDGGTANNGVDTSAEQSFTVTVNAVNDPPTLDAIGNLNLSEDAGQQTVSLTGITAGGGESQGLAVTATSSVPGLIPHPTVSYTSPAATGSLTFTPVPNASGVATVTVVVTDNGGTANGGVNAVTNTFTVTVSAVNDPPTLDPVADQLLAPGQALSLTLTAADLESPPGNLQFSLLSGPSGMTVSTAGSLQWTAAATETAVTNVVNVKVTDDGAPSQSATQTFNVVVIPKPLLQITKSGSGVTLQWPSVPGLRYQVQFITDAASSAWTDLGVENAATESTMSYPDSNISTPPKKFYRVRARF